MFIGIDLGISATKIIALNGKETCCEEIWEDPFSEDKLQDYLKRHHIEATDIEHFALTGVGNDQFGDSLLGIPAIHVDEFDANAKAARWLCKDETFIVVSLGTGTSFVLLDGPTSKHLGGSALGGGSLYGLFRLMLPGIDYSQFRSWRRQQGSLAQSSPRRDGHQLRQGESRLQSRRHRCRTGEPRSAEHRRDGSPCRQGIRHPHLRLHRSNDHTTPCT